MAIELVLLEDFKVIIKLGQTLTFGWNRTMVTVRIVDMITIVMLYIYPYRYVDLVLMIHKSI